MTGNGGPKRQPAAVHVRLLAAPTSAWVAGPSVRQVSAQPVTLVNDVPWSGTVLGSGTLTLAPPKYRPPQANVPVEQMPPGQSLIVVHGLSEFVPFAQTFGNGLPASSLIRPQVPVPVGLTVVNLSIVGSGVPQAQAKVPAPQVQHFEHTWPDAHPDPPGGSHCSPPDTIPSPQTVGIVVVVVGAGLQVAW